MLIGLSGFARSGKDTVAGILVRNHGFTQVAFADPLRASLKAINPLLEANEGYRHHYPPIRLLDALVVYGGSEGLKNSPYSDEWRRLQQKQGTEAGRHIHGEDCWVAAAFATISDYGRVTGDYVFSDCRFPNEAYAVQDRGGAVWRIERPGVAAANDHPSETSLNDYRFDAIIVNASSLDVLEYVVARHLELAVAQTA